MASKSEKTLGFLKNCPFLAYLDCLLYVLEVQNCLSVGLGSRMGFMDQKWVQ